MSAGLGSSGDGIIGGTPAGTTAGGFGIVCAGVGTDTAGTPSSICIAGLGVARPTVVVVGMPASEI